MNQLIKHIWFDFSETIASPNKDLHDKLRYETYASIMGKPITPNLEEEYEALFAKHMSNSAVFTALGFDAGYWSERISSIDPKVLLTLTDKDIPNVLDQLRKIIPISMWSNIHAARILPALGIDPKWFTHFLSPDEVKNPKPALDGFKLVIERSNLPPENILFVGDSLEKEIRPAKSLGIITGLIWGTSPEADYCFNSFKEILGVVRKSFYTR